jgi:hypothetical protein
MGSRCLYMRSLWNARTHGGNATMPAEPVTVDPPKHPLHAMTTFELRDYRRQLESALAFFGRQDPVPPARDRLQAALDAVVAEQDDRARLARA